MKPLEYGGRPEDFWQEIVPAGTYDVAPKAGFGDFFPAQLSDGRQLALPIRKRAESGEALASLIINQASLSVLETLADDLAGRVRAYRPDVIVALPTLGLALAQETARRLGHTRYVALSTSRKFWYDDELSVPMRSVTSPDQQKHLYLDPRLQPLLQDRSILLVDDVLSTGASIVAGCRLLEKCGVKPDLIGCAMLQTARWQDALRAHDPALVERVIGVFASPLLIRRDGGGWMPADNASEVG
ncbi:MAG: phosphoribosyltransferase [Alphaproteobacteria bacterium]|nr:phosphoribosyltransferase [Alphaproteobacteria bacterium]